ncbi:L-ascorbate oxidase-like protein [Hibiscus syriacus]|uniref:L-ascorbate oxidase-like protein n=1 Tax=Hibiscus syriacus TaxID=106335 RepID=A0A6A3B3V2_HIBSY|nr:L-ascorbate oxidase-like protein [Hibiscus syriacus]
MFLCQISSKFELRHFCRTAGTSALLKLSQLMADDLGFIDSISVEEIGGSRVTVVRSEEGGNKISTVLLRGSTDSILDDLERDVDDGVNTYKAMCRDSRIVLGATTTEIELAVAEIVTSRHFDTHIESEMIFAIAELESNRQPLAMQYDKKAKVTKVGIMQIFPTTAEWLVRECHISLYKVEEDPDILYRPFVNAREFSSRVEPTFKVFEFELDSARLHPYPGPNINSTTNNNIVINVFNHLDEPFLFTWSGIQQRKISWQDGVLETNYLIVPGTNFTYHFQVKDQIDSYIYYPSTAMHRALVVLVVLSHKELRGFLDRGRPLGRPDGVLINGKAGKVGAKQEALFTMEPGKTYRYRICNVGLKASINKSIILH